MTIELLSSTYDNPEKKWRDMAAEQQMSKGKLLKNKILVEIEECRKRNSAKGIVESC